ncbi:unnamed protein product, partial [Closterium sp. Yama58-4]
MARNKSPGSDGLPKELFEAHWDLLGESFMAMAKDFEGTAALPAEIKEAVTILLHKKGDKEQLNNYRPITLLNFAYKVLARVVADRMKSVLHMVISPEQYGFIPGRRLSDAVALVADIIEGAKNDKGDCYMLLVDFQKAFDSVSRDFLFQVLESMGFPEQFVGWIKGLHEDTTTKLLINGWLGEGVDVVSGVRQGCPWRPTSSVCCGAAGSGGGTEGAWDPEILITCLAARRVGLFITEKNPLKRDLMERAAKLPLGLDSFTAHKKLLKHWENGSAWWKQTVESFMRSPFSVKNLVGSREEVLRERLAFNADILLNGTTNPLGGQKDAQVPLDCAPYALFHPFPPDAAMHIAWTSAAKNAKKRKRIAKGGEAVLRAFEDSDDVAAAPPIDDVAVADEAREDFATCTPGEMEPRRKTRVEETAQLQQRGNALAQRGEFSAAIAAWDAAIGLSPLPRQRAVLFEQKAQVLMEMGRLWEAVRAGTCATQITPDWHDAWLTLARAQLNFGEPHLAQASFSRALTLQ